MTQPADPSLQPAPASAPAPQAPVGPTIKLVEKASGKDVDVPVDKAHEAFLSGGFGLRQGQTVPIVAPDGSMGTIAAEKAQAAFEKGAKVADPEAFRQAQLEAKHGGLGGSLAAAGEGAARGISLGLSDPLAVGVAGMFGGDKAREATRQHLEEEKETHPWLAGGGEALGAIAPIVLSGGTAAPEEAAGVLGRIGEGVRGLGALPRVVSGAGDLAEHAVGGMLGSTAETVLGRAGQAAAKQAARAVVEGGLFGAGQAESEATLQNQPLTAEKLMTSVGHSALYAGLIGGGLGGLGKLAGEGGAAVLGKLGPKLDEEAGEQAFKWLAPKNAVTREAIARAGGTDAVGRTVLDEVMRPLIEADGVAALRMDPEQKLEAIRDALDRKGAEIGEVAKAYPEAGATASKMVEPIDQAIDELSGKVGREGEVQTLQKLKSSFYRVLAGTPDLEEISQMGAQAAADAGFKSGSDAWRQFVDDYGAQAMSEHYASVDDQVIPIAKMMEQRRSLQQTAFKEAKSLDPNLRVELLRKIAGSWGDLEEKALNEASEEAGGAAGDQLKSLNKTFQRLKIAEKAAESTQASHATNRNFSMSDYLSGFGPGMTAALAGHPVGAVGGVASALLHRELRHHANAYAAIALDRLSTWGGISHAVTEVNEQVDRAVASAVGSGTRKKLGRAFHSSSGDTSARYDRERDRVQQIASMAAAVTGAHLAKQTAALQTHAPQTAQAVHADAQRTTAFLKSKLSPDVPVSPAMPNLKKTKVASAEDRAKFLRYVDAAEGRMPYVAQKLAAGRLTPEDMETAEACFPESLSEARAKAASKLAERTTPVDYQRTLQLTMFMGRPMDPTLEQPFIFHMQDALAKAAAAQSKADANSAKPGRPGKGGGGRVMDKVGKSMQTPTEQAMGAA